MTPEVIIGLSFTLGSALVGVTTWNVSLQGRVNGHDQLFAEREKQTDDRHADLQGRLTRIEGKLDKSLGLPQLKGQN